MTILLVDDSPTQMLALAQVLEAEGYADLLLAHSAAEALGLLAQSDPATLDLVLTDLIMPEVDGIEACRRMKSLPKWADTPIIMVTSSNETADLKLAFAAGAIDYIIKPADPVELVARVSSALNLKHATDERKARERELAALNQRLEGVLAALAAQHELLREEQARSEQLLLNILPAPIAHRLKQAPGVIADRFEEVTVLFADLVGFTELAAARSPEQVVGMLNEVFSHFDALADRHGLEKIKTIGDAYLAVGGAPMPRADHACAVVAMALDMQAAVRGIAGGELVVRIGVHSGPVVAGVIGARKFSYDLWGDTVNIASRMESHGAAGRVQISAATYQLVRGCFACEPRGCIAIKGRGELEAWYVVGPAPRLPAL